MHAFEMLINYQERSRIDDQRCDISSFIPKVRPHTCLSVSTTEHVQYVCGILRFYAVQYAKPEGTASGNLAVGIQT